MIFTIDEANDLIPWLSQVFESMEPLQLKVENLAFEMAMLKQRVSSNGGSSVENEVKNLESLINETTLTMKSTITEVLDKGIIVRSIPEGLVDFPYLLDGQEVYLCWIRGESVIGFYHETNTGYRDRQPI